MQKLWRSIFWKILSCGCFAGINVLVRYLSGGSSLELVEPLPIYSIMFFQHLIGVVIITGWMWRKQELHFNTLGTSRPFIHAVRIIMAVSGIGLFYVSLRYMPVTQAVAFSITTPIITTIGAVLFLKEDFNIQRQLAVFLSIVGGVLVARPDQALLNATGYGWYMLFPLLAALAFSCDKLLARKLLACDEKPRLLAWYLLAFTTPLSILPALHYGWVTPHINHVPWLILLGILGAAANFTFNKAYALADVTTLLPFGAARLILGAILSYVVFFEIPRSFDIWLGICILLSSIIILSADKHSALRMLRRFKLIKQEA
jgi:S-adenosylmethionine uptake transporter